MLPKAILLGLGILLLLTAISQGKQGAIYRSEIKTLQESSQKLTEDSKRLLEENKKQTEKIKKLEQDYQKLKISRSTSPNSQTSTQRVTYSVGCEKYKPLVAQYSWPVNTVMNIMYAESGCNPNAISSTNDHGLLQLHAIPIYDPAKNIAYAYYNKYLQGGFSHWTVCTNGTVSCW